MPKTESFDREQVLENAMSVFRQSGYAGSSMQELVDAMGINRSSLYNSFGDKHNLFRETLKLYRERQQRHTHSWLLKSSDAKQAIASLFDSILDDIARDTSKMGCFFAKSTSELGDVHSDVYEILTDNQRDMEALFADLIRKGQEEGQIDPGVDPAPMASYLFSSMQGLRVTGILRPERSYLQPIVKQILTNL